MLINPEAQLRVELVEGVIPVLFIDDFYQDPQEVRAEGLRASFDTSIALYPGRHAKLENVEARHVVHKICDVLTSLGDRVYEASTSFTDFSILTTKASDLLGQQKHPHIDPTPVLGLVYLNTAHSQGTCFYRNRVLGKHTIVGREENEALSIFLQTQGPTYEPETYEISGNAAWEKIYTIEGKFNRLVVYPGNVFHSIDVSDVPDVFDINTVRLTQRVIVQHTRPK